MSRRPISSRDWAWIRRLASLLAKSGISPNAISFSSLIFGVFAGIFLAMTGFFVSRFNTVFFIASAVLIQLRLLANVLDGLVAVEGGKRSPVGGIYNELPDRITDVAILIGAGYAAGSISELGWLSALLAVVVAYLRALGVTLGVGEAFLGIMAKPQRMFLMTVACVGCAFLPSRMFPLMAVILALISLGCVLTFVQRLLWISKKLKAAHE